MPELHLRQMQLWLNQLEKAISSKEKDEILKLYDQNISNPFFNWDPAPTDMQNKYDDLTSYGNAIVYGY